MSDKAAWSIVGLIGAVAFMFVTSLFWLGGFDFDERGRVAVWWLICSTVTALVGALITVILVGETSGGVIPHEPPALNEREESKT